jgi:Caspase domain
MIALIVTACFIVGVFLLIAGFFDSSIEEDDLDMINESDITDSETSNDEVDSETSDEVEQPIIDEIPIAEGKPEVEKIDYSAKVICIIGNEFLDKFQYGNDGALDGVYTDLVNVHTYYKQLGGWLNIYGEPLDNFERDVIHEKDATAEAMFDAVDRSWTVLSKFAGKKLAKFYSSGHGSQKWKMGDDLDNYAETYVLYNKMVVDDDFNAYIDSKFDSSVDVLIETDRCFSGGLSRAGLHVGVAKFLSPDITKNIDCYHRNSKKGKAVGNVRKKFIASSAENETSGDLGNEFGGEYTSKAYLIRRLKKDNISYADFISEVRKIVKGQTPKLSNYSKRSTWKDTLRIE